MDDAPGVGSRFYRFLYNASPCCGEDFANVKLLQT
jgi:hypothetical protein